jgi:chemotaxis protein MotB
MIANLLIFFIVLATFAAKNADNNAVPKKVLDKDVGIFGTAKEPPRTDIVRRRGDPSWDAKPAPESPSQRRGRDSEELRSKIQDASYRVRPKIADLGDGIRIAFEEDGAFEAGSEELSVDGRELVAEVGRFYAAEPVDLVVETHTDDRSFRFSRHPSELELTRAMAASVALVLARESGIEPPRIGISPFGADRPIETNATASGRARNRRVEIVVKERP